MYIRFCVKLFQRILYDCVSVRLLHSRLLEFWRWNISIFLPIKSWNNHRTLPNVQILRIPRNKRYTTVNPMGFRTYGFCSGTDNRLMHEYRNNVIKSNMIDNAPRMRHASSTESKQSYFHQVRHVRRKMFSFSTNGYFYNIFLCGYVPE